MIRLPLMPASILMFAATFGTLQAHPKEPDVSFLSEKAQTVLAQTKNLHEKIHDKFEAVCSPETLGDRSKMETCMTENESSLGVFKTIGRTLHEACLIGRGPGGPGGPEGRGHGGHGKGPGPLTDDQKKEFETKLTSDACSQAIASAQGKLQ